MNYHESMTQLTTSSSKYKLTSIRPLNWNISPRWPSYHQILLLKGILGPYTIIYLLCYWPVITLYHLTWNITHKCVISKKKWARNSHYRTLNDWPHREGVESHVSRGRIGEYRRERGFVPRQELWLRSSSGAAGSRMASFLSENGLDLTEKSTKPHESWTRLHALPDPAGSNRLLQKLGI